jgi:UPF0716 protein FxsA
MQIALLLLALAFPLLELAVLIKVGQMLGLWWTLLLLVVTGIAGGIIVQSQGLSAARRAAQSMSEGRPPIEPVVDSFMLMLAGTLLVIPGLLTDAMALVLLVPPARRWLARWALRRLFSAADVRVERHEWHSPGRDETDRDQRHRPPSTSGRGPVIDAEWEHVDKPKGPAKPVTDDRRRGT